MQKKTIVLLFGEEGSYSIKVIKITNRFFPKVNNYVFLNPINTTRERDGDTLS